MKQIKLKEDHYIVVDNSLDFSETDYYWDDKQKEIRTGSNNHVTGGYKIKITHSTQPIEIIHTSGVTMTNPPMGYINIIELPLFEVKELIGEVDVEKKVRNEMGIPDYLPTNSMSPSMQGSLEFGIKCYNQALEDNKEKKYTEEDIRKVILVEMARKYLSDVAAFEIDEIIQSLQPKTEWEVEFIDGKLKLK